MNDLHTIARLNAQAVEAAIPQEQAKGLWVVAEYAGLAFVDFTTHLSERDANAKAISITNDAHKPSARSKVFAPTKEVHPDDALLAALGAPDTSTYSDLYQFPESAPTRVGDMPADLQPDTAPAFESGGGGDAAGGGASGDF